MISAIVFIFWQEEELYIENCLKSLSFVDEVIVIDNGASQKTVEIAKKYADKYIFTKDKNFATRHNLGAENSKGEWLLFVDADERISKSLAEEIANEIKNPKFDSYQLNRINYFLGKKVRYGDRNPDYVTRLFKKESLITWTGEIHESSQVKGTIGKLLSPFYHLTHRDIFTMVEKTINYSEHEAKLRFDAKHPPVVWWRLIRVTLTEFFNRIIKLQGWRQGTEGWIDGLFQAFSLFVVYARLWEMQRKENLEKTYKKIDEEILKGEI